MILSSLRENLPDYAKDVKLNLSSVLTEEGAPGLTEKQIWGTALACTYSTKDPAFIAEIQDEALKFVGDAEKSTTGGPVGAITVTV